MTTDSSSTPFIYPGKVFLGPFIKIYAFWNHFWQIDFWRTNPHILIGSNDRAAKERCRWPSKDGLWWDLNLIPKFTKIFENSRNFQVIVVFIKNNAFRRNLSPWTLSRAGKSHWTSPNLRLGQTPFKMIIFNFFIIVIRFMGAYLHPVPWKKNLRY